MPQDLNDLTNKSTGISLHAQLIQRNTISLLGARFFPEGV